MGGAAAVSLALRYAGVFSAAFSYAGAFYASRREGDPYASERAGFCMMPSEREHNRVWGLPGSSTRRQYDPDALISEAVVANVVPKLFLEVGVDDYARVVEMNRKMHAALDAAGIQHTYREKRGDHSWPFAAASAQRALRALSAVLEAECSRHIG